MQGCIFYFIFLEEEEEGSGGFMLILLNQQRFSRWSPDKYLSWRMMGPLFWTPWWSFSPGEEHQPRQTLVGLSQVSVWSRARVKHSESGGQAWKVIGHSSRPIRFVFTASLPLARATGATLAVRGHPAASSCAPGGKWKHVAHPEKPSLPFFYYCFIVKMPSSFLITLPHPR